VKSESITVIVPATAPADLLESNSEVRFVRATQSLPVSALDAEMIVADRATLDVLPPLETFPRLRLVQTLSSGVDGIVEHVPDGVRLCNVGPGVHDASVAEWVVLVTLTSLRARGLTERLQGKRVLII
jgi:phosphoglycerate dehydrogenase-like enzyme